ncbi:NADP-dependent oxidoreductase [Mucilaginibacter sp.]|jgi:NADPH:quinone reductase-like Zn-dependent oxidoreductase|uniref:NADP-dependent oxidoreductase n=1 Tax=Mucilaginibacter sp. TaxID=1882438 RepID=UPI00356A0A02
MKAIILKNFGGVESLSLTEVPVPTIGADEILVLIKAISINPVDLKIRQGAKMVGREKDPLPLILGWDICGIITEIGAEVMGFKTGDEVFAMVNYPKLGNAYAEFVAAKASQLAIKPANINFDEGAAATLSALTAWQALTVHGKVKKNDRVLIHAASGGVGHFAVQMAKHLGAYVIGTSSAANKNFILSLGADEHVDYKNQVVEEVVSDIDYILDPLGGMNTEKSIELVNRGGTVISIVFGVTETLLKKAREKEVTAKNPQVKPSGANMKEIAILLENGSIKPYVGATFPFSEMANAHLLLQSGRAIGKITLNLLKV